MAESGNLAENVMMPYRVAELSVEANEDAEPDAE